MFLSRRSSAVFRPRLWLGWLALFALTARAHNTLTFDMNAPPGFSIGGAGNLSQLSSMIAMGTARLLPENLEIDLTMADGAAYNLLNPDPYQPPAAASAPAQSDASTSQPNPAGAHFNADQARLVQLGVTLFSIKHNGEVLAPLAVTTELTASQDIIFHLSYPPVSNGTLRLQLNCFDNAPAGEKAIVSVMDAAGHSLALVSLDAQSPAFDVSATPPAIAPVAAPSHNLLKIAAGLAMGCAVLWLLLKLRQGPARS